MSCIIGLTVVHVLLVSETAMAALQMSDGEDYEDDDILRDLRKRRAKHFARIEEINMLLGKMGQEQSWLFLWFVYVIHPSIVICSLEKVLISLSHCVFLTHCGL